jgi:hypothetical protein
MAPTLTFRAMRPAWPARATAGTRHFCEQAGSSEEPLTGNGIKAARRIRIGI